MNEIAFLEDNKIQELVIQLKNIELEKQKAGYNLFTISNQGSYLENFHSDIINSLLNPSGLHSEGYLFLILFIGFLQKSYASIIDEKDYKNVTVLREKGRIDVWIRDETSKHCMIIENKINNAPDRDNQLLDYYNLAIEEKYKVDSIIYLSLDGAKEAPRQDDGINCPVYNIPAYCNFPNDLLNGWLKKCTINATHEDSKAMLHQYCKLITHLSNKNMDREVKEEFYQFVANNKGIDTIAKIKSLIDELPNYRADKFHWATPSPTYRPFGNKFKYQNNYYIFEKYYNKDGAFKLDVFFENSGSARVVMWNYDKKENGGYETVVKLLDKIGLKERFNGVSRYTGLTADFDISNAYPDIKAIDEAVLLLVREIFQKLNGLKDE